MGNNFGNIVNLIFALIGVIIIVGIGIRVIKNYFSKEKATKATVIGKQCYDRRIYQKNGAPFTKKVYVVTFLCENKKKHFTVSELSYINCRVNQEGTLRHKGNRIIDFR